MIVPGNYFRDEALWRGHMLKFTVDLKATLYELGFWVAALYLAAFVATKWEMAPLLVGGGFFGRMLFGYFDEVQGRKRVQSDIGRYVDEVDPID